jgi:two-component system CheB/CheR fusion protein
VLFDIVQNKKDGEIIKIWVAACSTGEEAYTMAILLNELLQAVDKDIEIKIFATDIDLDAIEFASRGVYPVQSVAEMEDHLFRKYFIHQDGNVAISPALRKQIVFARHNILKDPPFIKNDLVTCRNMLIYMNNILQRKVFSTLQFSLKYRRVSFSGSKRSTDFHKGRLRGAEWQMEDIP